MILYLLSGLFFILILLFFMPIKGRSYKRDMPVRHMDERDTMFSRNEIKAGGKNFDEYYKLRPENKEADDNFRSKPGLLREGTSYYNKMAFAAAHASFEAVEAFFDLRSKNAAKGLPLRYFVASADGERAKGEGHGAGSMGDPSAGSGTDRNKEDLTIFVKEWAKKMGAHSAGIAEMKDYHFYTIGGRKERYGRPVENMHKYGIALTVEMDYELTITAPQSPIVMESARQYLNSGMIATQLALTLRNLGYKATTHIDANYDVICPLVAKDAGLGEIGRMGLLMTPKLGPRVRIAVVTTDAPLKADLPSHSDSVIDFCTKCKKCAHVCPSAAIPTDDRQQHKGGLHWKIDQEACFTYWCQAGTDCGRCMSVCPFSHKSNFLHDFVRWGINNNFFFRRIAVKLDDVFYGKKPKSAASPWWIA